MATAAEMRARVAQINSILEAGVSSNSVEGESTSFNHETLRDERRRLEEALGDRSRRHRVFNFNLGVGGA